MEFICVGKIVNTFGIKGELKIVSRFEAADKVFVKGNNIIINNNTYKITNVRFHHYNYLIEIDNIKDINNVEYLIGQDVFYNYDDLKFNDNEYLISELIDYKVFFNDKICGFVSSYDDNKINPLIKVDDKYFIPVNDNFIVNVDKKSKIIYCKNLEGLIC